MCDWTLEIALTESCDLNCFYCSLKDFFPYSVMNIHNVKNIIYAAHEVFGITTVTYTGGEPLLSDNLSLLIQKVGESHPRNLDQLIVTNACDLTVIREILKKKKTPVKFWVTLPACDDVTMEKVIGKSRFFEINDAISFLEKKRIPVQIHYPLIKNINANPTQIQQVMARYSKYQYTELYFDELECDDNNNLTARQYRVQKKSFYSLMEKWGFRAWMQKNGTVKFVKQEQKVYFYPRQQILSEVDGHTVYVTPDGYIRKNSFLNEKQQIKIEDFRIESILKDMWNFKKMFWKEL